MMMILVKMTESLILSRLINTLTRQLELRKIILPSSLYQVMLSETKLIWIGSSQIKAEKRSPLMTFRT